MNIETNIALSEKLYNISVVLDNYCKFNTEVEELQNISPIIEYMRNLADELCAEKESKDIYH